MVAIPVRVSPLTYRFALTIDSIGSVRNIVPRPRARTEVGAGSDVDGAQATRWPTRAPDLSNETLLFARRGLGDFIFQVKPQ